MDEKAAWTSLEMKTAPFNVDNGDLHDNITRKAIKSVGVCRIKCPSFTLHLERQETILDSI